MLFSLDLLYLKGQIKSFQRFYMFAFLVTFTSERVLLCLLLLTEVEKERRKLTSVNLIV